MRVLEAYSIISRGFLAIGLLAVVSGCVEPGEKTGIGAATGGAIGAGLGAIVGNQVGSTGEGLVLGGLAGAGAGAAMGNSLEVQDQAIQQQDEALERQERVIMAQQREIQELRRLGSDRVSYKDSIDRELSRGTTTTSTTTAYNSGSYNSASTARSGYSGSAGTASSANAIRSGAIGAPAYNPPAASNTAPAYTPPVAYNGVSGSTAAAIKPIQMSSTAVKSNIASKPAVSERSIAPADMNASDPLDPTEVPEKGSYTWREPAKLAPVAKQQAAQAGSDSGSIGDSNASRAQADITSGSGAAALGGSAECQQAQQEADSASSAQDVADKLFHYRRALRLCPGSASFHNGLGEVYISLNRKEDAAFEFQEALKLDPSFSAAQSNLSRVQ